MTWTTPRTWTDEELVTANFMNTEIRDNLNYLFQRPVSVVGHTGGGTYSTTSSTFVDIDATNLKVSLTPQTGRLMLMFSGYLYADVSPDLAGFRFLVGGSAVPAAVTVLGPTGTHYTIWAYTSGVNTGASVDVKVQWKANPPRTNYLLSDGDRPAWLAVWEG